MIFKKSTDKKLQDLGWYRTSQNPYKTVYLGHGIVVKILRKTTYMIMFEAEPRESKREQFGFTPRELKLFYKKARELQKEYK